MPTAQLGYSGTFSDKLKATIIYDVTRTTNNITVTNPIGQDLEVAYAEGSRYTAFLKMAEILYSVNKHINLRVGQLLSTQYLTVQDKFWGYRYVYFTYQEIHRYGNPADFGAQIDLKYGMFLNQVSVSNGDGPFKHQDSEGKYIYSNNLEVRPTENLLLKLYADYAPALEQVANAKDKSTISAFIGYKTNNYRVACEYSKVNNFGFSSNSSYYGISTFGSVKVSPAFDIFARYDYINKSSTLNITKGNFVLAGIQYKPHKNLNTSINIRSLTSENTASKMWIYTSFGVSF